MKTASHDEITAFVAHTSYLSHSLELIISFHEVNWEKTSATI